MGITERKERDRQEMRQHILEAAKTLFLREGFENVSIRRIAEGIEYSPATVYLYFKDRDEILYALHNEGFRMLLSRFRKLESIADPWERLYSIGREYVRFAFENREFYDLMFIMHAPGRVIMHCESWDEGMEVHQILVRTVESCMEAGYLPKADIHAAAFTFWSMVHGAVSLVIRNRCPMFDEEGSRNLIDQSLDFLMGAFQKR